MVKGTLLGAALMFALIATLLLILFHPLGREMSVGEAAIASATIWSPIFWESGSE